MKSKKVRMMMMVAALVLVGTLAMGTRALLRPPVETVSVTLHANGFEPSETVRAGGTFNLSVSNQSGVGTLSLKLTRDNGELVQEIAVAQGTAQATVEVTLPAGGYTLTEATHPAWLFHITAQ